MKNLYIFFILSLFFTIPSSFLIAQEITSSDQNIPYTSKNPLIEEELVTEVTPEIPKPGDLVTITVETYGINLNTELITWKINGVEQLKGIGQKKFEFTLGQAGAVSVVEVTVKPTNAPEIYKKFTFAPVDVDILWEAHTYTPPFYKGKALFTPESAVTFTAMPNIVVGGKRANPKDVVYTWKVDREVDGDNSGFGKQSYDYTGSIILRPTLIQAEVYAASNKSLTGINGFTLRHTYPQAVIYENNPLYGVLFNKAIRNQYSTRGDQVELAVFPYFFSTESKNSDITYRWDLDGAGTTIPKNENSVVFKRKTSSENSASIAITIENPLKVLQKAVSGLGLLFGEKTSGFGI